MEGVLVQQMVQNGVELMIGVAPDPLFGPLIAFGLGGIHVEIIVDVRFRVIRGDTHVLRVGNGENGSLNVVLRTHYLLLLKLVNVSPTTGRRIWVAGTLAAYGCCI